MKIAVIGSGGREHAVAWKLSQSKKVEKVYVLPGNGGTQNNISIDITDFSEIKKFCESNQVDLIFVGPEDPLANGIVDYFMESDIKVFGPDKKASQLESSKIFSKKFMKKYDIPTADSQEFNSAKSANDYIEKLNGNCVIKYDGLAAGKGVYVCSSIEEAKKSIADIIEKYGKDASFLIEEKLVGSELSILAFTDGENYQILLPSQDHKQLLDGDKGPNTGGMGAFCPVPFYTEELKNQIEEKTIKPTIAGLNSEKFNYKGVIYLGLMITKTGPKVLEYNVRLGDPETEVVLPALKSDLAELILSCFDGTLRDFEVEFNKGFFVDVVLTSGGYPKSYQKGHEITGLDQVSEDTLVFHAGTKKDGAKILSNGGRVLNIVVNGDTLEKAIEKVYKEGEKIKFKDIYYRKDIGKRSRDFTMNWKNELKSNITSLEELESYLNLNRKEKKLLKKVIERHPMSISKHYLSLIDFNDTKDPIRKMIIPSINELDISGSYDTSDEKSNTKFLGLQHKYSQTALFLSTHNCASYCRFCFRKRMVGATSQEILQNIERALTYINDHQEINNVLITGGDPLTLSTKLIEKFLNGLSKIEHLDFIRFGTKVPIFLPQRILGDSELLSILKNYSEKIKQIYFVLHINHPKEITKEFQAVVQKLLLSGIILNNQTVLMKNINDTPELLAELQNKLVKIGINPYYVFQCRPVKRVKNYFQIPLSKGYQVVEKAKAMMNGHSKRFKYIMSHKTGKIEIIGIKNDDIYFKYHQAKDKKNQGKFFKKKLKASACWLDEL
ncbi:MAG: phosphoribosylamine--glycine ligase [Candidatus Cloacimonetes bacterium]|nr:phosphoribosylamine--glycine ligase [Candidatus Cloacimonadota bacterium]